MGCLVAVASADHVGDDVPRRDRVKARETLDLVKSMIVIGCF